jgi:predicted nucleotidyltransferase
MYSGLDDEGFIISEVSIDNILPEYKQVIEDCTAQIEDRLPDLVHSVYVYGSVARGNPVRGKSDLDLLIIFNRHLSNEERKTLSLTLEMLSKIYRSLIREVGVADCTVEEMLDPKSKYGWGAYLKILCVCIDGEDLTKRFEKFKLTPAIALGINGDVGRYIDDALLKIQNNATTNDEAGNIASTLARKLIRSCYSMVMSRAQIWSTKLDEQAQVFMQYFPEESDFISTLQLWINNPPKDKGVIIEVLNRDGKWLTNNFAIEAEKLSF